MDTIFYFFNFLIQIYCILHFEHLTSLKSATRLETSPSVRAVSPHFSKLVPRSSSFLFSFTSKLNVKRNGNSQETEPYQGKYFLRQTNAFIYVKVFHFLYSLFFCLDKGFQRHWIMKRLKICHCLFWVMHLFKALESSMMGNGATTA